MDKVESKAFLALDVLPNETEFNLYALLRRKYPSSQIVCRQNSKCSSFGLINYLIDKKILSKDEIELDNDPSGKGFQGHTNIDWNDDARNGNKYHPINRIERFEKEEEDYVFGGGSDPNKGASFIEPLNCTLTFTYEGTLMVFYRFITRDGFDKTEVNFLIWDDSNSNQKGTRLGRTLFDEVFRWERILRQQIWIFDERWMKDTKMFSSIQNICKEDIILPQHLLKSMSKDIKTFFSGRDLFIHARIPWRRGLLLMGPPGNGKTATIKALLQDHLDKPILYVKSFQTGRMGTSEKGIRMVFSKARSCAPCFLILEDLDSLVDDSIRSFVLNEIDGLTNNDGIILIASTNHPDKLDDAFLRRPSRFDRKYTFDCPSKEERTLYLQHWFTNRLEKSFQIVQDKELNEKILEATEGWSFALLQELFVSFSMQSLRAKVQGDPQSKQQLQESILEILNNLNIEQTKSAEKEAEKEKSEEEAKKREIE